MNSYDIMLSYHGTTEAVVDELINGNIDRTIGGGELGQGFYLSNLSHVARAWGWRKHKSNRILGIEMIESDFWALNILALSYEQAVQRRFYIRRRGETRTYIFNSDTVWAPIVGRHLNADQYKYESEISEDFLNGDDVIRTKL